MKKIRAFVVIGICSLYIYVLTGCQDGTISTFENVESFETDVVSGVYDAPMIAFPNVEGELLELGVGDYKVIVEKKVVDGETYYILGGDMILSDDQVEFLRNRGREIIIGKATDIQETGTGLDPSYSTFLTDLNSLWPNNTVYYSFNSNLTTSERNIINQAIDHWRNNTNLTFTLRTNQTKYIQFIAKSPGSGCSAPLGMPNGIGEIRLARADSDGRTCFTQSVIRHEIGHAVGLIHEHQRSDRNNFVTIHTQNINLSSGKIKTNFNIYGGRSLSEGFEIGPLDFNSIMIYHSCAFSINQQLCNSSTATITRTNGSIYSMFPNTSLSFGDREGVKYLYYPGVFVRFNITLDQNQSWEDFPDHHRVYNATAYFYTDSNFSQPKTLDYPIGLRFRDNISEQNFWETMPTSYANHYRVEIPSGVSSWFLGQEKDITYYDGPNIEYLYQNWFQRKESIGYAF